MFRYLMLSLTLVATLWGGTPSKGPSTLLLKDGWHIYAAQRLEVEGAELSQAGFDSSDWYPAQVPSTVCGNLIELGIYKDIFLGKNLELIPVHPFLQPWWYRTEFNVEQVGPEFPSRLLFDGINYKADIWLNGRQVAGRDKVHGVWKTFDLDITAFLKKGQNALAVKVYPPQMGDFTIGFVDWSPQPADANMGIFREVRLRQSGVVSIEEPFVRTTVDKNSLKAAQIVLDVTLVNHGDLPQQVILSGSFEQGRFEVPYALKAHERRTLHLDSAQIADFKVSNPRLWWPLHLGEPNLTHLALTLRNQKNLSDSQEITFGIREVGEFLNAEGYKGFTVNGKQLLIRGGAWVDDMFLREDSRNLEAQFNYIRHMNLNTIRLEGYWGCSQRLYDLADRYGILVMVGFSCQWEWPEYLGKPQDKIPDSPVGGAYNRKDRDLLAAYLGDQVRWLRNHPSLLVWALGSDKLPTPEAERQYRAVLAQADTSRPILSCFKHFSSEVSGPSGVKMTGPYDYVTPNYWYLDTSNGGAFGFNTETGSGPQIPPLVSLKKMIPENKLWPINEAWEYHCARREFGTLFTFLTAFNARYGEAKTLEEFAFKVQAANYEAARAMFEAFGAARPKATGVIHWMLNGAWPKMIWQLYDHYLTPSGAFYGVRKACEPIHISYDYGSHRVQIVNDTLKGFKGGILRVRLLDASSRVELDREIKVDQAAQGAKTVLDLAALNPASPIYFLDLRLVDAKGKSVSTNFYWLATKADVLDPTRNSWMAMANSSYADFKALNSLPVAKVRMEQQMGRGEVIVTLHNDSDKVAFFLELQLLKTKSQEMVLPVLWADNNFSLLPGEVRTVRVRFESADLGGEAPRSILQGWNLGR
jgi:exo-1,4-beta-D-glucosaminidase